MFAELPLPPPKGFRKGIPVVVKLKVVLKQNSLCPTCREPLGKLEGLEFDHVPALQLRCWDPQAEDTIPPANDVEHIFAKHIDCHAAKTFGSKASKRGADVTEIARTKRIARETEAFRQRILAKNDPDAEPPPDRRKTRWPKRPFQNRGKNESGSSRGSEGSGAVEE